MNTIDFKSEVTRAIQSEWRVFEQYHPRLAAVIDQSLLVEQAMISLMDDPEYQHVMNQAASMTPAFDLARDLVGRVVKSLLDALA